MLRYAGNGHLAVCRTSACAVHFDKTTFIKEVPGFITYTSGGTAATYSAGASGGTNNFGGPNVADHLDIVTAPGEFDIKLGDLPVKAYWDFAANLDGKQRIQDVYLGNGEAAGTFPAATAGVRAPSIASTQNQNRSLGDNIAWLAGVQVGQNKKKGDWSIKGDFRQVGLGSIDPNLNDSDWGDSFLNQQGVRIQSVYNFTDFLTGSVTYYDTWALKQSLFNGASSGQNPNGLPISATAGTNGVIGLAGASTTQRVQVDLAWKF